MAGTGQDRPGKVRVVMQMEVEGLSVAAVGMAQFRISNIYLHRYLSPSRNKANQWVKQAVLLLGRGRWGLRTGTRRRGEQ